MMTILLCAVVFFASLIQGLTGFGFGLVAVSLLGLIVGIKEASLLVVLASLIMKVNIFCHVWKHFRFKLVWITMVGILIGTPLGVCFLAKGDAPTFSLILGGVILLALLFKWMPGAKLPMSPLYAGFPAGLFSGLLHGAFNTGGPPLVIYYSSIASDKMVYSAALQFLLFVSVVFRIILLGAGGLFDKNILLQSAFCSVFAVAGSTVGVKMMKKIPMKKLSIGINILLLLVALKYIYAAFVAG